MIDPETIIDGRYKVHSRIGSGGMADVYLAEDQLLGRWVAVKVLHHRFAEDQEFVERFRREASSAAGLSHPNIVAIFDRGEWNSTYYIVMEYVSGRSLKTIVREQGALEVPVAIDIVVQILRAARFAHKRGIIHRDLKPHNVILDEEGRAKVADFGIARAGASDMTLTGSIMGTAQYLSPEQAQGHAVSEASDLYAVGIVLYELLTGAIPFDGETAVTIALKQVSAEPPPPSALNPAVPVALDAVVHHALAKDPAQRFADAEEFIAALQSVGGASSVATPTLAEAPLPGGAPAPGTVLLPVTGVTDSEGDWNDDHHRTKRRRRWLWATVFAIALAVLAVLLLLPASRVTVPDVTGQTQAVALASLKHSGLTGVPTSATSATVPTGVVISQDPSEASVVAKGSKVTITVSIGAVGTPLANLTGQTEEQALRALRKQKLRPITQTESSTKIERGHVISTEPSAGTDVKAGSQVKVFVSSGPPRVLVPDVVNKSQAGAAEALESVGLKLGTVTQRVSSEAPGTVLSQSPHAGASLPAGEAVNLVEAKASTEVVVPSVVGKTGTQAANELGAAGFKVGEIAQTVTESAQEGVVLEQSPAAGHKAKRGATITIKVGTAKQTTTTTTPTTPVGTTPIPSEAP